MTMNSLRRRQLGLLLLFHLIATLAHADQDPFASKQRGVAWVAGGEIAGDELDAIVELGADWIAQTPFGWMKTRDRPAVGLATGGHILWGETDHGLVTTARAAHARGLKVALKPHLWIRGSWPGDVAMTGEREWKQWFVAYERFILHYAELAQRHDTDLFVIGTELKLTTRAREADWRRLIRRVRAVFDGPLTYAANWDEVWDVPFWDALDCIGVDAYFPLSEDDRPERAELIAAWRPVVERLAALAEKNDRPVLFTEAGYRPVAACAARPWEHRGGNVDDRCQAIAIDALFGALWHEPWFAGVWVWKWFPHGPRAGRASFSPQGRPAARVIGRWFDGSHSTAFSSDTAISR